ncbi:hypothetical protein KKG45_05575 [bacterium]|nr:hypothetical protein [bacterium]MBU1072700.1 hypothetical protein [bacterium]MBU1676494.1 hypothetical protein [bacterium]
MKKLIISLLLIASLAATGCMQMEMATNLAKDGSGTYEFAMTMSTEVEQALNELSKMEGGMGDEMGDMPDFADFDKSSFEKKLGEYDVKMKSFVNEVKDGKRTVRMALEFKDFQGLQAAMALAMGENEGIGIEKLDDGNYLLKSIDNPIALGEEQQEAPDKEPNMEDMQAAMANAGKSMELMGKLMAHSSELAMTMKITLPSDVIEHNAPKLEGRTCIWEINSGNMMAAESMDPHIVFSGKGVNIK